MLQLDRQDTSAKCVENMLKTIEMLQKNEIKAIGATCMSVGLKCGTVSSRYDLIYITNEENLYAIDVRDDQNVYVLNCSK
jgi:hypothetical protein